MSLHSFSHKEEGELLFFFVQNQTFELNTPHHHHHLPPLLNIEIFLSKVGRDNHEKLKLGKQNLKAFNSSFCGFLLRKCKLSVLCSRSLFPFSFPFRFICSCFGRDVLLNSQPHTISLNSSNKKERVVVYLHLTKSFPNPNFSSNRKRKRKEKKRKILSLLFVSKPFELYDDDVGSSVAQTQLPP